jgi:hypothetical protein
MSHTYTPGTKLTYCTDASSVNPATKVTVITDGNVFVLEGLGAGTIMKYADWLIIAGLEPIPMTTPLPVPTHTIDIGTKFKWMLNEETYRVAIQTADGVLQVKSVTDGAGDVHGDACYCVRCLYSTGRLPLKQTLFANEDSWRASLPRGGIITTTSGPRSKGEQMAQAHNEFIDSRDKLQEYMRRFNVRSKVVEHGIQCYMKTPAAARIRAIIANKVYEVALKGDKIASDIALREMVPFAPVRLFKAVNHITRDLGKPSFYALHYGRKIQLPNM